MTVLRVKRSSTNNAPPASGALVFGELGMRSDGTLYGGDSSGNTVLLAGPGDVVSLTGDVTGSGTNSINTTLANSGITAGTYTKITFNAKGLATVGALLAAADIPTLTSLKISDFDSQVRTSRLDQMAAPTAAVSLNNQRITNLADPQNSQDAATLSWVTSLYHGGGTFRYARAASTANINLSAPGTAVFDGVTLNTGEVFFAKDQTTGAQNGLYTFNGTASAATRTSDFNSTSNIRAGAIIIVTEGTANGDTAWLLTTDAANITAIGTSSLAFSRYPLFSSYASTNPITLTGNTFSLNYSSGTLGLNASNQLIVRGGTAGRPLISAGSTNEAAFGALNLATAGNVVNSLPVGNGGTGVSTITGLIKGNGTSAFSAATEITASTGDYLGLNSVAGSSTLIIDGGTVTW